MLNKENLNTDLKKDFEDKMISIISDYTINGQEVTKGTPVNISIGEAELQGLADNTVMKYLIKSISDKVIEHFIENAETIGSYAAINRVSTDLQAVITNMETFLNTLNTWVPVPLDGGAALKVILTANIPSIISSLNSVKQDLTSMVIEKNII